MQAICRVVLSSVDSNVDQQGHSKRIAYNFDWNVTFGCWDMEKEKRKRSEGEGNKRRDIAEKPMKWLIKEDE